MVFKDREEAGRLLANRLGNYQGEDAVILALPRGGLPVARPVADRLGAPLDILVARKIGAPGNEEFALGAVTARGVRVTNERALRYVLLPPGYLEEKTREQRAVAAQRETYFRGVREPLPLANKVTILVDDGIATGMTMRAAIEDVRLQSPLKLVVAAPVIAPETLKDLQDMVDEVIVLDVPEVFFSVSQFYQSFPQVSDEEARDALLAHQP